MPRRRTWWPLAVPLALVALEAACGGSSPTSSTPGGGGGTVASHNAGRDWAPVLRRDPLNSDCVPPQTIILRPVHIAEWLRRAAGVLSEGAIAVHESPAGSYPPPAKRGAPPFIPPHTIILVPVHTAVWAQRPSGTPGAVEVSAHEFPTGSY